MSNLDEYNNVFIKCLQVLVVQLNDLTYRSVPGWDSVGHMVLIASIENTFKIVLEPEDIRSFMSYKKGIDILIKYGVTF